MSFFDRLLSKHAYDTMFGCAHVITMPDEHGRPVRILRLDGTYQSASYTGNRWADPPFQYFRTFDAVFQAESNAMRIESILLLGGGGFAWPKHVLTTRKHVAMDVIEVDPQIVKIARDHFYVDELERYLSREGHRDRLNIVIQDARAYLAGTSKRYDVIVNDLFQGERVPDHTQADAFLHSVKEHLNPGGIYAINVVVDLAREGAREMFWLMNGLNEVFQCVCTIDASDESFGGADNHIVLASDEDYAFKDATPYTF